MNEEAYIKIERPIGYLIHRPTKTQIAIFSHIGWFKRMMIKWCFGLEYIERKPESMEDKK